MASLPAIAQHLPIVKVEGSPKGIESLYQDSKGRLWVGTENDLYVHDGSQFYHVHDFGKPMHAPRAFAEDSDGGLWFVTAGGYRSAPAADGSIAVGGVYRYFQGKVEKMADGGGDSVVQVAPGLMAVTKMSFDYWVDGDLWLFRKSANGWQGSRILQRQVAPIHQDHDGNLLFACPGGWCELSRQQLVHWPQLGSQPVLHPFKTRTGTPIQDAMRDQFGCVWLASSADNYFGCGTHPEFRALPAELLTPQSDPPLIEAPDGNVVVGFNFAYGRPGHFLVAHGANGIPEDIHAATIGRDGTLWFGNNEGVYRFTYPSRMEYWVASDGINSPHGMLATGGHVYYSKSGIFVLDSTRSRWQQLPGTEKLGIIDKMEPGPDGTIYATGFARDLTQLKPDGTVVAFSDAPQRGQGLATDASGRLWLASSNGVFAVTRAGGRLVESKQPIGFASADTIQADLIHRMVIACDPNHIIVESHGLWQTVQTPLDKELGLCQSIAVTRGGEVWLSYSTDTISELDLSTIPKNDLTQLTLRTYRDPLEDTKVHTYFLQPDKRGWLWRAAHEQPEDGEFVATEQDAEAGHWLRMGYWDGIPHPGGNVNASALDPDGSIWWASGNTIVHFNPAPDFATNFPVPQITIAGYSIGNAAPVLAEQVREVPHGQDVVAYIGSTQFDRRNGIQLRYRMLPEQQEWQQDRDELGRLLRKFDLHFRKLRWGTHTLQVQAKMGKGATASAWSPVEEQSFRVLPPVWLGWPALGGYAAVLAAGTLGGRRWSRMKKDRDRKTLPDLAEWRLEALSPGMNKLQSQLLGDRFRVGPLLARGGFASVFEGTDEQADRRACAIKIFRRELLDKEWMAKRFAQEVLALQRIQHPNVVAIYGSGETEDGALYLVMEYIEGETLRQRMDHGQLPRQDVAAYLRQAGSALQAIHRQGICHRDLKPENILLRANQKNSSQLVLIDFSIAIVKDPDETMHGISRAAGTLQYMAPEQAIGYAEPATDIYSLTRILLEMLTGQRMAEMLPNASMDMPARVHELLAASRLGLSAATMKAISQALEFDPGRRPKDAWHFSNAVADDLELT